jgi:hypothetical protein
VAAVVIVSGNNQHAKAGEPFAAPLVVRVTDSAGRGVRDAQVTFTISAGAAGLLAKSAEPVSPEPTAIANTGQDGSAHMTLIPFEVGPISISARVHGSNSAAAMFTADSAGVVIEFWSPQSFGNYASFVGPCSCPRKFNITTVPVGTVVEWKSLDDQPYTVTSTSAPRAMDFDSGPLVRNSRFQFVTNQPGTWEYRDLVSGISATLVAK